MPVPRSFACQNENFVNTFINCAFPGNGGEVQWCFSQVKGTLEEDISEGKGNNYYFLVVLF